MAASQLSALQRCAAAGRVLRSGCSSLPRLRLARLVTAALNPPKPPPPPYDWRRYINQFVPPAFFNPCLLVEIPFGAIGDQSPLTQWSDLVSFLPFLIRADFFVTRTRRGGRKGAPFLALVRFRDPIDSRETAFLCFRWVARREIPPKVCCLEPIWAKKGPKGAANPLPSQKIPKRLVVVFDRWRPGSIHLSGEEKGKRRTREERRGRPPRSSRIAACR